MTGPARDGLVRVGDAGLDLERAAAMVFLALALGGVGYSLALIVRQPASDKPQAIVAPQPAPPPAPAAVPEPVRQPSTPLAFPLPGLEHALRDNFDEKRGTRRHQALDIMAPRGTPVHAVDDGRIAKLYRGPLAGLAIYQFDPATTRVYFYAHLDRYLPGLKEGQEVKRGDVIGYVGSTGNAPESAPHLHFSMHQLGDDKRWWRGTPVNPYPLLKN